MTRPIGFLKPMAILTFLALTAIAPSVAQAQSDIATYQGADRTQRLLDGAKKEGTLTIYSSATVKDLKVLTSAFEKKYGIKTKVWRASSENIIQRATTEARGGRFDVDVFETDGVAMEAIHREKLLQAVKTPYLKDILPAAIPPHGEWIGDRVQIFTAAYNTNLLKKSELPKTYTDLLDSKWKGKLAIEQGDYDWFSAVVKKLGEKKGVKLFQNIVAKNGISVRKGHTLIANLVVSGEIPLSLTTYLYKVQQFESKGAPIGSLTLPPEVARAQGTGLARKAPHPYAGVLYMDFLLSEGQKIYAKRHFIPTNVKVQPLPEGTTLQFIDPAEILDHHAKWEKLFQETFVDRSH